jgi:hypothetical protein
MRLEVVGNLERWEKGLKAKERQILMMHWLAATKCTAINRE